MQSRILSLDTAEARHRLDVLDAAVRLCRTRTRQTLHLVFLGVFVVFVSTRAPWFDFRAAAWASWVLCVLAGSYVLYASRDLFVRAGYALPSGPSLVSSRAILRMLSDPDDVAWCREVDEGDVELAFSCDRRAGDAERLQPLTLFLFLLGLGLAMVGIFLSKTLPAVVGCSAIALSLLAYVVEVRLVRRMSHMVVLMLGNVSGVVKRYGLDVSRAKCGEW